MSGVRSLSECKKFLGFFGPSIEKCTFELGRTFAYYIGSIG